jgi:hypothetical protein
MIFRLRLEAGRTPRQWRYIVTTRIKPSLTARLRHSFMATFEAAVAIRYDAPWGDQVAQRSVKIPGAPPHERL